MIGDCPKNKYGGDTLVMMKRRNNLRLCLQNVWAIIRAGIDTDNLMEPSIHNIFNYVIKAFRFLRVASAHMSVSYPKQHHLV